MTEPCPAPAKERVSTSHHSEISHWVVAQMRMIEEMRPKIATNMPPITTLRPCLDTKRPATVDDTEFNSAEGMPTQPAISAEYPSPFWKDRKSTRLNSSHVAISYAVFCLKKKRS